jgi:transcriptional regulator GlxA family with amidase domain
MQRRYPKIAAHEDRIFMIDGPIWTSAGMSAGIDLALGLFADDLRVYLARVVAKILVAYHRRAGGQSGFSALLDLDAESDRIRAALAYAKEHLSAPLLVQALARVAFLSLGNSADFSGRKRNSHPRRQLNGCAWNLRG